MHLSLYIYIYIYTHIYIFKLTHTHTHTHTYMNSWNIRLHTMIIILKSPNLPDSNLNEERNKRLVEKKSVSELQSG